MYPNPANDQITIELNSENNNNTEVIATIQLIGLEGKIINQETFQDAGFHKMFFDVSSLEQGMYFIRYSNSSNTQINVKPFIKK